MKEWRGAGRGRRRGKERGGGREKKREGEWWGRERDEVE